MAPDNAFNIVVHSGISKMVVKTKTAEDSIAAAKLVGALSEHRAAFMRSFMRSVRVPVITAGLVASGVTV